GPARCGSTHPLQPIPMNITPIYYVLAALVALASLGILFTQEVLHALLLFMVSSMGLAGIYFLQGASFLAVVHTIMQASSCLVMILFSIMLFSTAPGSTLRRSRGVLVVGSLLGAGCIHMVSWPLPAVAASRAIQDVVVDLGLTWVSIYGLGMEMGGVILLIALIGAVYIAGDKDTR
ncbi:MAG: NADH-quinone oxidoreductase subunit J, partial [Bacteroidota bacterium]